MSQVIFNKNLILLLNLQKYFQCFSKVFVWENGWSCDNFYIMWPSIPSVNSTFQSYVKRSWIQTNQWRCIHEVWILIGFELHTACAYIIPRGTMTSSVKYGKGNSCIDGVALIISGVRFPKAKCHCNDIISHLRNSLTGAHSVALIWMPIILDDNPSTQQTSTCDNWEFGSKISLKRTVC